MHSIKTSILAGILAVLLLLSGCAVFTEKDRPVPEEYQQTAEIIFEDAASP